MLVEDGRVLLRLLRGQPRAANHADRLEAFYAPQAEHYDRFRERLLHGRRELIERLDPRPGQSVVELGGGTGRNLEFLGDRVGTLGRFAVDRVRLHGRDLAVVFDPGGRHYSSTLGGQTCDGLCVFVDGFLAAHSRTLRPLLIDIATLNGV